MNDMSTPKWAVHPVAEIFPPMSSAEFDALKADIAEHGVREALWTYAGQVLDGRHRLRACDELGLAPPTRPYLGDDPVGFVVSLNLHRRHLDEGQRGLVAKAVSNMTVGGDRVSGHCANLRNGQISQERAAEMLNVSRRTVQHASKVVDEGVPELVAAVQSGRVSISAASTIAEVPKEQQREIVARGEREILEAAKAIRAERADERRTERVAKLVEIARGNAPLGAVAERYPVLYADPPWRYEHAESESRAIENQYPTMSLDEIKALPVGDCTTDDCVLFLWATSPKLAESLEVLSAWGFTYRTCAVWDKQKIGMGYYFRQQHELLLVATKGQPPTPRPGDRVSSVFSYPRGEHSSKPHEVYGLIEAMYGELPKLELFCRTPRDGWGVWGNQAKAA